MVTTIKGGALILDMKDYGAFATGTKKPLKHDEYNRALKAKGKSLRFINFVTMHGGVECTPLRIEYRGTEVRCLMKNPSSGKEEEFIISSDGMQFLD